MKNQSLTPKRKHVHGITHKPHLKGDIREGRRYSVGSHRIGATRKVRYVETNDPKKNCRFL